MSDIHTIYTTSKAKNKFALGDLVECDFISGLGVIVSTPNAIYDMYFVCFNLEYPCQIDEADLKLSSISQNRPNVIDINFQKIIPVYEGAYFNIIERLKYEPAKAIVNELIEKDFIKFWQGEKSDSSILSERFIVLRGSLKIIFPNQD